jgi:CRISPR system Cascade subunit CasA
MPRFDLVDEGWLPCVRADGSRADVGLREALLRAHELRELSDPSPLVTVSLHRLLLAVLHRSHGGPANLVTWADLWRRGRWDEATVANYLGRWRHRFDLFDVERPFYQVPRMDDAKMHPIALLAQEAASGNNATLFDHSISESPFAVPPAVAARRLVASQAFALGGGVSQPFNLSHAPLVRGYSVLTVGDSLFETLALNLLPYNAETPIPRQGDDLPAWEEEDLRVPVRAGTPPRGWVDYLTWQSRQIHLVPEGDSPMVPRCQLRQNLKILDLPRTDPFQCYRTTGTEGVHARRFDPDKALWRDSHALFHVQDSTRSAPEAFNTLARIEDLRRRGRINARPAYNIAVFGLLTDARKTASVVLWRHERLPLPLAYLTEDQLRQRLEEALTLADSVVRALGTGIRELAKLLLAPASDDPKRRQPRNDDVSKLRRRLGADRRYWARLEVPFARLLVTLPNDWVPDEDDEREYGGRQIPLWKGVLEREAWRAFDETTRGFDRAGRDLKAVAKARGTFGYQLREALGERGEVADGTAS